jgi:hypothetical protein
MLNIFNINIQDAEKIADLNKTEQAIVRVLKKARKPLPLGVIMEALRLKRLVVFYNLRKLEKRGLAIRDMANRAHVWRLSDSLTEHKQEKVSHRKSVSIRDVYQLLNDSQSKKLFGIQGAGAVNSIIRMSQSMINFSKIHRRQKLRQVIIDGILTDKGVIIMKNLPPSVLRSHFGRPSILHVIPDNSFITDREMLSDGKMLVSINHAKKIASITQKSEIIEGFLSLFESLKGVASSKIPQDVYGEIE